MSFGRFKLDTVRRWYCQLNEWEWPKNIPLRQPANMDSDDPDFKAAWKKVVHELAWRNVRDYYGDVYDKEKQRRARR